MSDLPFLIVCEDGAWAEAEDEASALVAARTLRKDSMQGAQGRPPTVHIAYEGWNVLVISGSRCV